MKLRVTYGADVMIYLCGASGFEKLSLNVVFSGPNGEAGSCILPVRSSLTEILRVYYCSDIASLK